MLAPVPESEVPESLAVCGIIAGDGSPSRMNPGQYQCKLCQIGPFQSLSEAEAHLVSSIHLRREQQQVRNLSRDRKIPKLSNGSRHAPTRNGIVAQANHHSGKLSRVANSHLTGTPTPHSQLHHAAEVFTSREQPSTYEPDLAEAESPVKKDRAGTFKQLVEELSEEHERQLEELRKENEELKSRLNSVLSSTWGLHNEEWHSSPREMGHPALRLVTESSYAAEEHDKEEIETWSIPADQAGLVGVESSAHTFNARNVWYSIGGSGEVASSPTKMLQQSLELKSNRGEEVDEEASLHGIEKFIVDPASSHRLVWDFTGMCLLFYDFVMIPLGFFDPLDHTFWQFMDWVTLLFWSSDMVASFLTGYIHQGKTISDPSLIARHYLHTWLGLDIVIVGSDWIFTLTRTAIGSGEGGEGGGDNVAKLLRTFRVIRVLRLLRIAKLKRLLSAFKDSIESEWVFLVVAIVQIMLLVIFANHLLGCAWYLVGDLTKMDGDSNNWIDASHLAGRTLFFRYSSSIHWSLAQFGLGSVDIHPQNSAERAYAICVLVLGMVIFSSFTASIASSMVQLRNMRGQNDRQFWLLRRFLRQNSVPSSLSTRILRYLEYASTAQEELVPQSRLTILSFLSDQLQGELQYMVDFSSILKHPLFRSIHKLSAVGSRMLARAAFERKVLVSGDTLFTPRTMAKYMYFVVEGELGYAKHGKPACTVSAEDWLTEAALWVPWQHLGGARARTETQLIFVNVSSFAEEIQKDEGMWALMSGYAKSFSKWLNSLELDELSDVSLSEESQTKVEQFIHEQLDDDEYAILKKRGDSLTRPHQSKYAWT
eukprot:gnl/TRDRNA2_/TRDRNA2_176397_c0_seq1.p1 gnl/TRDRNA2_/TRDRNA2_176397_c0~~gnl/TRDRNA2_/TRDRNA2_176397_c0_seq1.p1  ORF type:complete len:830 (+),score=107.48 gnl/TRDRNA2_/TRDRNA2_176397_c0_seq1:24-2492(+)